MVKFHKDQVRQPLIKLNFFILLNYDQVFLVAGGSNLNSDDISSTETLVEGAQAWNFQQQLPRRRSGLCGISLPNTVIMTGKKVFTFTFNRQTKLIVSSFICIITHFAKLFILHKIIFWKMIKSLCALVGALKIFSVLVAP